MVRAAGREEGKRDGTGQGMEGGGVKHGEQYKEKEDGGTFSRMERKKVKLMGQGFLWGCSFPL